MIYFHPKSTKICPPIRSTVYNGAAYIRSYDNKEEGREETV